MKFGKLPESELNTVDFSLPAEPAGNRKILGGIKKDPVKIHIGCPQWGVPGWVGKIYPAKAREKDFLANYVQHFNGIELNATHYKITMKQPLPNGLIRPMAATLFFVPNYTRASPI